MKLNLGAKQVLKREQQKADREKLELTLLLQLRGFKIPNLQRNYRFHPTRKYELDLAWPDFLFGVEVQGGTYNGGKHARGPGYTTDCRKLGEAMLLGWSVYWCDSRLVSTGEAADVIQKLVNIRS